MSGWLTLAALLAAAAAPVLGIQAGASSGTTRLVLLACTGLAAAFGVGIATLQRLEAQHRQQESEEVAEESREESFLALAGALGPATHYLGALAAAGSDADRRTLLGQLVQAALNAAVVVGPPDTRSVLYLAQSDRGSLVRAAWSGRSGEPRPRLVAGTVEGDFALGLVQHGKVHLVADVRGHPHVQPSVPGAYDAVAVAVVMAGTLSYGLLTVDSPGAGSLTPVEADLLQLLAHAVGAGLALVGGVPSIAQEEP